MSKVILTMLNSMGGPDFETSLDTHAQWGIRMLDLKDRIFSKGVADLTTDEARRAREMIDQREMAVTNLSTGLFGGQIEQGERFFTENYLDRVGHVVEIARILGARSIRLLAARTDNRQSIDQSTPYLCEHHPWLIPAYGQAVDRIRGAGFNALLENEVDNCIWSGPDEILSFFAELDRPGEARLMWDIQNLWQMGTFPSLEVYARLKGIIGQVHLKGGRSDIDGGPLVWASSLAEASWPVGKIVSQVLADAVSPVICLNPSHGKAPRGFDHSLTARRDVEFLRETFAGIE